MAGMKPVTLFKTGLVGSVLTALCCLTPLLVWLFAALGVSAWLAYADAVLFPALAIFLGLIVLALMRRRRS
jgi:mercuric ion transport protein